MTKGIKRLVLSFVAVCLCLFGSVATGCNDEAEFETIPYIPPKNCDVVAECSADYGEDVTYFMAICRSIEEMTETFVSNGHVSTYAIQTARAYLEGHPEGKVLVVCTFYQGGYAAKFRVQEVEVKEGKLTMYVYRPGLQLHKDGWYIEDTVISPVCLVAGVDESLVDGVTELDYVITR